MYLYFVSSLRLCPLFSRTCTWLIRFCRLCQSPKYSGATSNSSSFSTSCIACRHTDLQLSSAPARCSATDPSNASCNRRFRMSPMYIRPPGFNTSSAPLSTFSKYSRPGKYWITEFNITVSYQPRFSSRKSSAPR